MLDELPPWALEALRTGAVVLVPFMVIAIGWLVRKLDEREKARAQADEKHFATLSSMQPMIREMTAAIQANTAIVASANDSTSRSIDRLNERLFSARQRDGR